jgi:ribose transport system permease protein
VSGPASLLRDVRPAPVAPDRPRAPSVLRRPELPATVALAALVAFFSIWRTDAFATGQMARNIGLNAAVLLIVAVGTTFVLTAGGFDLSSGSVLVLSGVAGAQVINGMGGGETSVFVGVLVAVAVGAACGLVNGLLVGLVRLPALIVTLAMLGAALGISQLLTGGFDETLSSRSARSFGLGRTLFVPNLVWSALAIAAVGTVVMRRTQFGRWTTAIGSSRQAATRAGIPVARQTVAVYALGGALAGLAGALSVFRFGVTSLNGFSTLTLEALMIAVLGGTSLFGGRGTVVGTVIAALVPGTLQSGLVVTGVEPYWQSIVVAGVLVAAVYLDRLRPGQAQV